MLSGLFIKIIHFLFFSLYLPSPLVYLMFTPHNHIIALHYFNN